VLLAAALALITFDSWGGAAGAASPVAGLRGIGGTVFGSAESLVGAVTRPVAAFFGNVSGAPASQQQITGLQREVIRLRAELSQARLSKAQEAQLRRLLALAGRGGYRVVAANVIAASHGYNSSVTIDAGRDDGIKPDETVLNGAGLVGTVTSVAARTSTVLLTTDASSTVGVRLAGTGRSGRSPAPAGPGPVPCCCGCRYSTRAPCSSPGSRWSRSGRSTGGRTCPASPWG
jgi:rod shape-determining protein MreC